MNRAAPFPSRLSRVALGILTASLLILCAFVARAATPAEATDLRFGDHGNRTRIVIDFDREVSFATRTELDPDRLELDVVDVAWHLGENAGRPRRGMARGYDLVATPDGQSRLIVALARPARVASAILLPPNRDSASYRLVLDLAAAEREEVVAAKPALTEAEADDSAQTVSRPGAPVPASRPVALAGAVGSQLDGRVRASAGTNGHELPVVVLDPGHGGTDPGAISVSGLYEKTIVLEMARELETLIERSGRYRVALTRESDAYIPLRDRIAKARRLGGDVFISLHADSLRLADMRGASIYTLSEKASDEEAAKFAAQENKADILVDADLSQHDAMVATILIDLAQRDTNNRSIALADALAEELARVTSLVKRHRRFAGFAVLKSPEMPSVLLELGYLSNPDDERNLAQPDYRAKLGQAIVRSLDRYFGVPRS
ncbi:MAG: N-acetylmuramoyl-L-alanine amidase [Geminicoccaceae bacterium]